MYRIKRLYPQYIIALLICIFCMRFSGVLGISNQWSISKKYQEYDEILTPLVVFLNNILDYQGKIRIMKEYGFKEILMIHFWPWGTEYWHIANIPTWYISVMFIFQFNSIWIV